MNVVAWQARKRAHLDAWGEARRILLVRLDSLGDAILMTPAFHAIKETQPGAHLTLLTSPVGAQLMGLDPDLDDVLVYNSPMSDAWLELPHTPERELGLVATLREREFDGAIIWTSYHQSPLPAAMLAYLAGIPLRAGATDDGAGSLLTTRHHWPPGLYHEVDRALSLVGALGYHTRDAQLVLRVPAAVRRAVWRRLKAAGVDPLRLLVVLHPGCSMPARTYDWQRFAAVADLLAARLDAQVVLTGSAAEVPLVARVQSRLAHPAVSWAGQSSLAELAALIEMADLVITNNTGPAHIAAAVRTPVVDLFAWTNPPEQWRPWRVPQRLLNRPVPCRLCYQRICPYDHSCLDLSPAQVVEAATDLLEEVRAPAKAVGAT
ncbi:MAG TPA: glycosyltransferase family 9 protein [Anaerolineae bacterium]|nr:glycosyltransferase family 9 protein [Anaerolineae bacterium]HOR00215.1 glycosyltransferase family 9 protein [Anaerolineae bacterium]HPL28270.1 glycosyltransferase family 9 protein [Anaerolineae bacterium]